MAKCRNIYDWIKKFNQFINFERKKKTKKPINLPTSVKKENETGEQIALNQFQTTIFGFLKEESPFKNETVTDTKQEKEHGISSPLKIDKDAMDIEAPLSENKDNEDNEEEFTKKAESNPTNPLTMSTKKFSKAKRNNLIYYFKFPELLILFYKFLKISIHVDELLHLKTYLNEINVFLFYFIY